MTTALQRKTRSWRTGTTPPARSSLRLDDGRRASSSDSLRTWRGMAAAIVIGACIWVLLGLGVLALFA